MEVKFHAFLTPVFDVGKFSASRLCPLIRGKEDPMRNACVATCAQEIYRHGKIQTYADAGNWIPILL
jgi:hypothetical protein